MDERLRLFITTLGVKQIEISKKLGISHSNITRYLKGARIPITVALSLQAKFTLSHKWLLDATGPMFLKTEALDNESVELLEDYYCLDEEAQKDIQNYLGLHKFKRRYKPAHADKKLAGNTQPAMSHLAFGHEKELLDLWRETNDAERKRIILIIKTLRENSQAAIAPTIPNPQNIPNNSTPSSFSK